MPTRSTRRTALPIAVSLMLALASPHAVAAASSTAISANHRQEHHDARPYVEDWLRQHDLPLQETLSPRCDSNTAFARWMTQQSALLSAEDVEFLALTGAAQLPYIEAQTRLDIDSLDFSLRLHERDLQHTFQRLQSFWNLGDPTLRLAGFHGEMLVNPGRVASTYTVMGVPAVAAEELGRYVADYVAHSAALRGGNNPLLTANAFATPANDSADSRPGTVVLGDGILAAYDALGFSDVAPQVLLAHEYAHVVQFAMGTSRGEGLSSAGESLWAELEADASASYFVSHPCGLSMQRTRVVDVLAVDHSLGDCAVEEEGHHGTRHNASQPGHGASSCRSHRDHAPPSSNPTRSARASPLHCPAFWEGDPRGASPARSGTVGDASCTLGMELRVAPPDMTMAPARDPLAGAIPSVGGPGSAPGVPQPVGYRLPGPTRRNTTNSREKGDEQERNPQRRQPRCVQTGAPCDQQYQCHPEPACSEAEDDPGDKATGGTVGPGEHDEWSFRSVDSCLGWSMSQGDQRHWYGARPVRRPGHHGWRRAPRLVRPAPSAIGQPDGRSDGARRYGCQLAPRQTDEPLRSAHEAPAMRPAGRHR